MGFPDAPVFQDIRCWRIWPRRCRMSSTSLRPMGSYPRYRRWRLMPQPKEVFQCRFLDYLGTDCWLHHQQGRQWLGSGSSPRYRAWHRRCRRRRLLVWRHRCERHHRPESVQLVGRNRWRNPHFGFTTPSADEPPIDKLQRAKAVRQHRRKP